MLLTIETSHSPATDLGHLLHKHPDRLQRFDLSFGRALVFYPEATPERCQAALLLEVDPVRLVRGHAGSDASGPLAQYVNDRPYAASSLLSVALSKVFRTAMAGRCEARPELAETAIPLKARLPVLPSRGGEALLRELFEPLGYEVSAKRLPLDERFPEWGESRYFEVELSATRRLADLLSHLYTLVPVLDNEKHYWVGTDEVEKLLRQGGEWLKAHPQRELIASRYLKRRGALTRMAMERLLESDGQSEDPDEAASESDRAEAAIEKPLGLHAQRLEAAKDALLAAGAKRALDLGCGEGKLLHLLLKQKQFEEIAGLDVSRRSLEIAEKRLKLDRLSEAQRQRISLWHGSLCYRDRRLEGWDGAALVEVIEHLDPPRLAALERVVFEFARPKTVVVTTPNAEYNVRFETLPAGRFRHPDHRFEWTRAEFQAWARALAERFGYAVTFAPAGPEDPEVGAATQMGVFALNSME